MELVKGLAEERPPGAAEWSRAGWGPDPGTGGSGAPEQEEVGAVLSLGSGPREAGGGPYDELVKVEGQRRGGFLTRL